MHVVTHLLSGWLVADAVKLQKRDRSLTAWSSVAADADGVGYLVDFGNRMLGHGQTLYYETWHHYLGHGLPGAVLTAAVAAFLGVAPRRVALMSFCSFHLHLLLDYFGSRGSNPEDIWEIAYLAPFSDRLSGAWVHQWPLTSWQNTMITALLLAIVLHRAFRRGYSVVSLFSDRADAAFVNALRSRFSREPAGRRSAPPTVR